MILPDDFDMLHPSDQLEMLLHRNMSLILQRMGVRDDIEYKRQMLEMDIAYAQSSRLGATYRSEDRADVERVADHIERSARAKLEAGAI